jgi:hypothetical protein
MRLHGEPERLIEVASHLTTCESQAIALRVDEIIPLNAHRHRATHRSGVEGLRHDGDEAAIAGDVDLCAGLGSERDVHARGIDEGQQRVAATPHEPGVGRDFLNGR